MHECTLRVCILTHIQNNFFLRTQFRLTQLAAFPFHVVKDREVAPPDNLEQLPEDLIFNVAGYVHGIGPPPPDGGSALPAPSGRARPWRVAVHGAFRGKCSQCCSCASYQDGCVRRQEALLAGHHRSKDNPFHLVLGKPALAASARRERTMWDTTQR